MKKTPKTRVIQLLSLVTVFTAIANSACSTTRIEEPGYTSVMKEEAFEIREYSPRIVAQTIASGSQKEASNKAFRILADYIFGNNISQSNIDMTSPVMQRKKSEKIAMTAPVTQSRIETSSPSDSEQSTSDWIVQFTMPSEYTLESLPVPNNPEVQLKELPSSRYAVLRFSGRVNDSLVNEKIKELQLLAESKNLRPSGETVLAQYNPPWTLGPMRRNEVLMPLQNK